MGGFMDKKKIFAMAKGYRGRSKNCYRLAYRRVEKALQHSYVGRKLKKRDHRSVWIQRINAGARQYDLQYGRFIWGLQQTGIELNRKMLSQLAMNEPLSFGAIVHTVQQEQRIPPKTYSNYGLLQSTVPEESFIKKLPLPKWNIGPITANLGFQPKGQ